MLFGQMRDYLGMTTLMMCGLMLPVLKRWGRLVFNCRWNNGRPIRDGMRREYAAWDAI